MNAELTRVVSEGIDGQRVIKLFDGYEVERAASPSSAASCAASPCARPRPTPR